ncbi:MAG TPA: hypothetical protein VK536_05425, partial [Candidatus Limnocylindrales bacterium]|nr:hypothetical protein [Candidatus Limnocylindrales bacterium]
NGFITENNTTGPFNVQYTGLKSVTIPHWCNYTPNISDIALTVLQGTPVTDWNYDMLQVTGSDATNLYCMVVVTSGSATSNAYASVGVKVNRCQKG